MKSELYLYPEVTQEQLEALKDEVRDFSVLCTQDIKNNNLEIDENGKVLVKKGTLLHGTTYEDNETPKIESISVNGIITKEFFGQEETGSTNYHVEYYKANKDMLLSEFLKDERELFPNETNLVIGFLVIQGPELTELFKSDSLVSDSNVTEDIRKLVEKGKTFHEKELLEDKLAAIPIGMPTNCFSAVVVSDKIKEDKNKISKLHELFNKCYILDINGDILENPVD